MAIESDPFRGAPPVQRLANPETMGEEVPVVDESQSSVVNDADESDSNATATPDESEVTIAVEDVPRETSDATDD